MKNLDKFNPQQVLAIKKLQEALRECEQADIRISSVFEYLVTIHDTADVPKKYNLGIS